MGQESGLTITHLYPNRLVVDVSGPVASVQKAFGVQLDNYKLGSKTFYANNHDPVIPASLSGIVESVDGLSSLQTMFPASPGYKEPASPVYSPGPVVSKGAHGGANGSRVKLRAAMRASRNKPNITGGSYDPTDIYSSQGYDYSALYSQSHCCNPLGNPNVTPAATSIAIATFGSQDPADFTGFHNQYSYLAYHFQEIYIDGTPACCDGEGTMDMEWSTAMSNSFGSLVDTSMVYLYDGANFNNSTFTDMYNKMVSDNAARVFSTSWSCTETYGCSSSTISTRDAIFSQMVGQGWTLVAASGDRGAFDDCSHLSVAYPASDPNVVGAGGTELSLSSGPVFNFETAWAGGPDGCNSNDGGSGGGCSSMFAAPGFQSNQPCGSGSRAVPDISLNADWYHTPQNYYRGGLFGNGGTSIVAPELAGFFAQENSYRLSLGNVCAGFNPCSTIGNANYALYNSAIFGAPHDPYYDTLSGCNSNDIGSGYCAGTGWDAVTGWGSANMLQLAWAINWETMPDAGRPVATFSGASPGVWYNTNQSIGASIADTGSPATGVAGFSAALNGDPGDPTSEGTPGSGNSFYSGPQYPKATSGGWNLSSFGQGCNYLHVRAWDNMGYQSPDTVDGPLCYDSVAPSITKTPTVSLQNHAAPVKPGSVPLLVQWNGSDSTSGINHYTVYESKDGTGFTQVALPGGPSAVIDVAPGHTYRFEVTGTDNASNTSGAAVSLTYTLAQKQENDSAVAYSSGWTRRTLPGSDGGSIEYASLAGNTATLTFSGRGQVAWVSTLHPTRGSAKVTLDSGAAKTINTHATTITKAVIVDVVKTKSGAHHLVINVAGTHGHPQVDVDAFVILTH